MVGKYTKFHTEHKIPNIGTHAQDMTSRFRTSDDIDSYSVVIYFGSSVAITMQWSLS